MKYQHKADVIFCFIPDFWLLIDDKLCSRQIWWTLLCVNTHKHTFHSSLAYYQSSHIRQRFITMKHPFSKKDAEKTNKTKLYLSVVSTDWLPGKHGLVPTGLGFSHLYQRPPNLPPHNTLTVFLLGSECKAITHWRVCLNHTEWLWILNAGLGPTEKQAHGGDSVSGVLIWFLNFDFFVFFTHGSGNTLLTGKSHCSCSRPSMPPQQEHIFSPKGNDVAMKNILSSTWKKYRKLPQQITFKPKTCTHLIYQSEDKSVSPKREHELNVLNVCCCVFFRTLELKCIPSRLLIAWNAQMICFARKTECSEGHPHGC